MCQCMWVCRSVGGCACVCDVWVCAGVQVGVAVGGLTIMNFLNTSWRLESKCQWPLIHILYDFLFVFH